MAEKYRWSERLATHPLLQLLAEEIKDKLPKNESRNLLAEKNGEVFVWFPAKNRVLTTNLKNVLFENDRANKYQVRQSYVYCHILVDYNQIWSIS